MSFPRWLSELRSAFIPSRLKRQPHRARGLRAAGRRPALDILEDRCLMSFSPAVVYPTGAAPLAVVTADFNGDGRRDVAVANDMASNVSVLLANADGTLQPALNSATDGGAWSLAVGDFNGDGKPDLVTANRNVSAVSVLIGNGDGTFQARPGISLGSDPVSVAVGDFNADGKLDLAVTSYYRTSGSWNWYYYYPGHNEGLANVLLGTGTGSFAAPTVTDLGPGYPTSAALADFNNDGKLDFAAGNAEYGNVSVLLGTGTGTLQSRVGSSGPLSLGVSAGDVTGDGKPDLIAACASGVAVLVGSGNGTFAYTSAQIYTLASTGSAVTLADCNGDGRPDLVAADYSNNVNVLLNNGAGAFRPPVTVGIGAGAGGPVGVAAGDLNGDGRPDVATANMSTGNASVLLNDGTWPPLDAPSLSLNDVSVTEGNTGTTSATFTVKLSAASGQTVSVHYDTVDGSATSAGGDYQAASGTLTFAPGVTSQTITVLVNGDRLAESSESFSLRLGDPVNAFVADGTGTVSIADDEPHVRIDYGPVYVTEGNAGTTTALFTVRLAAAYDAPVSVSYSTVEGDTDFPVWGYYYGYYYIEGPPKATAGSDFQAAAGSVTFAPGETVKTIPITVYGDRLAEPDEAFSVNLGTSATATVDTVHAVGFIVDDEPRVSIGTATAVEGNTGTKSLAFTVTLTAAATQDVTVSYATADYSATAGSDYQAVSGTMTIPAGQTTGKINVPITGDRVGELDEYFYVNLTGATGALITNGAGWGTIQDDEPRINIAGGSVTEGNKGTKLMTFTVTLSVAYDQTVTVHYNTNDWTATAGTDYVATSGTLTFAAGQTSKTFTVTIKGDTKKEADETFFVSLSNASSNALIEYYEAGGTILNDDGRAGGKPNRR
jgi:hypothetical protein